jgi:hypothetical protein
MLAHGDAHTMCKQSLYLTQNLEYRYLALCYVVRWMNLFLASENFSRG